LKVIVFFGFKKQEVILQYDYMFRIDFQYRRMAFGVWYPINPSALVWCWEEQRTALNLNPKLFTITVNGLIQDQSQKLCVNYKKI